MKITDKNKFITSCGITIALIVFIIILLTNISFSHTEVKYKKIYISSGDTLWAIAKLEQSNNKYFENNDIRDIIYQIKKVNNLDNNCNLQIGEELKIPTI